jgi:hypothetical protein
MNAATICCGRDHRRASRKLTGTSFGCCFLISINILYLADIMISDLLLGVWSRDGVDFSLT